MLLFGPGTEFAEGAGGALWEQELSWCKLSLVLGSLRRAHVVNSPFSWMCRQAVSSVGMLVTLLCINPKIDFYGDLLVLFNNCTK